MFKTGYAGDIHNALFIFQELEVGANPVQVETGEFDEAIEVVEDVIAESELINSLTVTPFFECGVKS